GAMGHRFHPPGHDAGGNHQEHQHECHQQARRHHPAEVDHRADIAHHQGHERHHGGEHCVQAGNEHGGYGLSHQLDLGPVRVAPVQLPVAHHQVDADGDGDDQQHQYEIGGNHRQPPVEPAKGPEHDHHRQGTGGKRQDDPAGLAKDHRQGDDDEQHHADAEHHHVAHHIVDDVGTDHRGAAEEQFRPVPVTVHQGAHVVHTLTILVVEGRAVFADLVA